MDGDGRRDRSPVLPHALSLARLTVRPSIHTTRPDTFMPRLDHRALTGPLARRGRLVHDH